MDYMDSESACSTNSSDINLPKDYSLSSLDLCTKSDRYETNNNSTVSKSMKLNFGVERLLSKKDYEKSEKPVYIPCVNDNDSLINLSANSQYPENGSNQLGINLLHQQLIHTDNNNELGNQNLVLKPFPLRFGRNHNGYTHQPPSYFQSNLRKMSISSNIASAPSYSTVNAYQNILRLPTLPQLSPSNNIAHYFNSRMSKSAECDQKAQELGCPNGSSNVKRKRSWSRAVFSNLQRKGLERQFEFQKYITKPDRKKLAARLGLKDAQVKVWFQNRRMKWRHSTRGTSIGKVVNSHENSDMNDEERFTSSDDDEDTEIDVVTDH